MARKDLKELLIVTNQLKNTVNQKVSPKNRAKIIDAINNLIDERELLIANLQPPYTANEKEIGQTIVEENKVINRKAEEIFTNLKHQIRQMNQQKRTNMSYENPYKSVQVMDGMFLDQKK